MSTHKKTLIPLLIFTVLFFACSKKKTGRAFGSHRPGNCLDKSNRMWVIAGMDTSSTGPAHTLNDVWWSK